MAQNRKDKAAAALPKTPTGIRGLDAITGGGLPKGRPTLVVGGAGSGKTLLGMEFLIRGATEFDEPGVFVTFEETARELAANVRSLGFDVTALIAKKKILIDHVHIDRNEIEETGEYDLQGLFVRLGYAVDSIGAKRVVLDTIEALFGGLSDSPILRSELQRLFRWLKDKGITAVVTAEQGSGTLTRQGLEEYVSDAVIFLDHRVVNQISTRRLRVIKYRGSSHGTNEYPFLIDRQGFAVLPVTSVGLDHAAPSERVSTGIPALDSMLSGQGYYRGSTILVSGTAGSGKTSLAAYFVDAACRRGEKCLYFAFEESTPQVLRNMRSIDMDLEPWVKKGLLRFEPGRPTLYGLETHLARMHQAIDEFRPRIVVIDPVSDLGVIGAPFEVKSMLMRLIDHLKSSNMTALLTSLVGAGGPAQQTEVGISSLIDTWLLVRDIEMNGERTRGLYILKSRGMAHSSQVREFLLTDHGVELVDVYLGPEGVLVGSARAAQEVRERAEVQQREQDRERRKLELERKRKVTEAQIAALRAELEAGEREAQQLSAQETARDEQAADERATLTKARQVGNGHSVGK